MVTKDILDIWDAIRILREEVRRLQEANTKTNGDFLLRSYESITEKLEVLQKDVDTLKSR